MSNNMVSIALRDLRLFMHLLSHTRAVFWAIAARFFKDLSQYILPWTLWNSQISFFKTGRHKFPTLMLYVIPRTLAEQSITI